MDMRRTYSDGMVIWMNGLDVYMHSMAFEGYEDIWSLKTQTNKNHMYKPNFIQLPLSRSSASFQLRILSAQGPLLKKEASCFHSFCTHKGKKARDISPASQFFAESQINASHSHHAPHPIPCMT